MGQKNDQSVAAEPCGREIGSKWINLNINWLEQFQAFLRETPG